MHVLTKPLWSSGYPRVRVLSTGGEDYELLFTISQDDVKTIEKYADVHMIGYMDKKEKGAVMVTIQESIIELQAQGWKHFD